MSSPCKPESAASGGVAVRAASAAVLAPVALAAVWFGGPAFAAFALLAGLLMAWEFSRLGFPESRTWYFTFLFGGAVVIASLLAFIGVRPVYLVAYGAFWLAAVALWAVHRPGSVWWALLGVPYVSVPVYALIALRGDPQYGMLCVIWLLLVVWVTDSAAFFVGRAVGGPKLAPGISPRKTWSGAIGGTLFAALAGAGFAVAAGLPGMVLLSVLTAVLSIVGQVGDLLESALKRRAGVKDSSALIPGHGGVLDRLDSLLTVSVAALIAGLFRAGYGRAGEGVLVWPW